MNPPELPGLWPDAATLAAIASVITAFSVAMLIFRVQRELDMGAAGEARWIPWSDWLLLLASTLSLVGVLLPLVAADPLGKVRQLVPGAACAAAVVVVAWYPFAVLAHYRLILRGSRQGPRENPEPAERWIVLLALASACVASGYSCWLHGLTLDGI
jgi:hypothetical protein